MKPRKPNRRIRVTVPGKSVTGRVSPAEIEAYLVATGWSPRYIAWHPKHPQKHAIIVPERGSGDEIDGWRTDVPREYRRVTTDGMQRLDSPRERLYIDYYGSIECYLARVAKYEKRSPGEVLLDIEALAGRDNGAPCPDCGLWVTPDPDLPHVCPEPPTERNPRPEDEAPPPTERERPMFRTLTLKVPLDRGVGAIVQAAPEIDGYRVYHVEREGTEAILILKRIDR